MRVQTYCVTNAPAQAKAATTGIGFSKKASTTDIKSPTAPAYIFPVASSTAGKVMAERVAYGT